jgi:citrate lyase subunit beta/citryl-CoA lyase
MTPGVEPFKLQDSLVSALASGADAVILDLEDPRLPSPYTEPTRIAAREFVRERFAAIPARQVHPQLWVRVQGIDTRNTLQDLLAVVQPALSGIILPKSTGPRDVIAAEALLDQVEVVNGVPHGQVRIWPLLETPGGIRQAYELAMASPRVAYMGGMAGISGDQARLIGFTWSRGGVETQYARTKAVIDARSAGIRFPIGGMWCGDGDDLDGLREFAIETRNLGYYGMLLARSKHVAAVNEVFTPSPADAAHWEEIEQIGARAAERSDAYMSRMTEDGTEVQVHFHDVEMAQTKMELISGLRATGAIDF